MLHIGTLVALLVYFRADWLRLVPAGLAAIRDRSFDGDPDRRLGVAPCRRDGPALDRRRRCSTTLAEQRFREVGLVALMLVVGGAILWLAERRGSRRLMAIDLTFPKALAIGVAQALALVPGISRSGISISAGLFAGLDRESAARFSFLMATPITAGRGRVRDAQGPDRRNRCRRSRPRRSSPGCSPRSCPGLLAIAFLLRFLRTRSTDIFVAYRDRPRRGRARGLAAAEHGHDRWRS